MRREYDSSKWRRRTTNLGLPAGFNVGRQMAVTDLPVTTQRAMPLIIECTSTRSSKSTECLCEMSTRSQINVGHKRLTGFKNRFSELPVACQWVLKDQSDKKQNGDSYTCIRGLLKMGVDTEQRSIQLNLHYSHSCLFDRVNDLNNFDGSNSE
jgi:hypothetical protein